MKKVSVASKLFHLDAGVRVKTGEIYHELSFNELSGYFMSIKRTLVSIAIGLAIISASTMPAHAGLMGSSVQTRLYGAGYDLSIVTSTVGDGIDGGFFDGNIVFDYTNNGFNLISSSNGCGVMCGAQTVFVELGSLNFGTPITGVTFTSTLSGVTTSYTNNSVGFSWIDQPLQQGTFISANFQTAPVPEPETYAMLLAGLGVMGFMGKRRRKAI